MGCAPCRQSDELRTFDLGIPEEKQGAALGTLASVESLSANGKDKCMHNAIRLSKPCHVKLATDRGKPWRALLPEDQAKCFGESSKRQPDDGEESIKPDGLETNIKSERVADEFVIMKNRPRANETARRALKKIIPDRVNASGKADSSHSVGSCGSVVFDQECLVVEKKGSIYNEYKVVDLLGRGTFGEVKKVVHRVSGNAYAMKMINKKFCSKVTNIMNEIEILKKLVHYFFQYCHYRIIQISSDYTSSHKTRTSFI